MHKRGFRLAACFTFLLCGCTVVSRDLAASGEVYLDAANAAALAADVLPQLQKVFSPGSTTFVLSGATKPRPLREALDRALRRGGYAVASRSDEPGGVPIMSGVDRLDEVEVRLTVSAGESFQTNRLYEPNDLGVLEPESGFTQRNDPLPPARRPKLRSWAKLLAPTPEASIGASGHGALAGRANRPPVAKESAIPASPVTGHQALAVRATMPPPEPAPTDPAPEEDVIMLTPNGDHIIEISAALFAGANAANPFVQQYRPKTPAHELTLFLSGIALGPQPTTVLNERVYSIGEHIDGFRIEAISRDLVLLRWENFILRIPLQDHPIVVRYP